MVVDMFGGALSRRSWHAHPAGEGIVGQVVRSGKPYLTNNPQPDEFVFLKEGQPPKALAAAPLIAKEETIGALIVSSPQPLSETDLRLLTAISEIAASAPPCGFEETHAATPGCTAHH
jgi:GAF domain-containing protein